MDKICDYSICTGCMSCYNSCPVHAISMLPDKEGFLYPAIDSKLCIDCKLCKRVCPINTTPKLEPIINVFSGWSKDDTTRISSSSGGAFTEIAKIILNKGGVVFGCSLDSEMKATHIYIDSDKDIYRLRGSKYVQSYIGDSYKKAKEFLEKGQYVLFSGTPCQIAGLKNYLKRDYDNLLTVDLICHGVPSPLIFDNYKKYISNKYDLGKITRINFRDKINSWRYFNISIQGNKKGKKYIGGVFDDPFLRGFLKDYYMRNSCYNCQFTKTLRAADITIGDWWNYTATENIDRNFKRKGVSLITVNTNKGEQILESLNMTLRKRTLEEALRTNQCLHAPYKKPLDRNDFWSLFLKTGFKSTVDVYLKPERIDIGTRILNKFPNTDIVVLLSKILRRIFKLVKL